jgi:hypothetical protein
MTTIGKEYITDISLIGKIILHYNKTNNEYRLIKIIKIDDERWVSYKLIESNINRILNSELYHDINVARLYLNDDWHYKIINERKDLDEIMVELL